MWNLGAKKLAIFLQFGVVEGNIMDPQVGTAGCYSKKQAKVALFLQLLRWCYFHLFTETCVFLYFWSQIHENFSFSSFQCALCFCKVSSKNLVARKRSTMQLQIMHIRISIFGSITQNNPSLYFYALSFIDKLCFGIFLLYAPFSSINNSELQHWYHNHRHKQPDEQTYLRACGILRCKWYLLLE